jgi:sarcosine oxidase gamma subunit
MSEPLRMDNLSRRPRCGCKGPGAEAWLATQGYRVPAGPNSAALDSNGHLVARLATSEFLIEAVDDAAAGEASDRVALTRMQLLQRSHPTDVYPVAREDLVIELRGPGLNALLRQTCSVDFAPMLAAAISGDGRIIMTSMIGVGVLAWPRRAAGEPALTLWSDPSYAHYFWHTLLEVGQADGSVSIGSDT